MNDLVWIEISREAILNNLKTLRSLIGEDRILAPCVKANAYGHGAVEVAKICMASSIVDWLCVNAIEEAEELRTAGITLPIMVIGYVQIPDFQRVLDNDIKIFISNYESAEAISKLASEAGKTGTVHIKVDTGMGRQGIMDDQAVEFFHSIKNLPALNIEGMATHFATSDKPKDPSYFNEQLERFKKIKEALAGNDLMFHCANSATTLVHPEAHFDLVRTGLATYGYYPSKDIEEICIANGVKLLPSLTLKTRVGLVKKLPAGAYINYGCTKITERPTKVAVLPIGYYDGIDRGLSNHGSVIIGGEKAPVMGRICMDIMVVDVTDTPNVKIGDEVVFIGKQGKHNINNVEEIATALGTITYEVTTRLRGGIKKIVI